MHPKSPKQEESSKMCVFIGNSITICCAMCSWKWVPLGGGIGQKEGGLEVRQRTVETTEYHQAGICIQPSRDLLLPRDCTELLRRAWSLGFLYGGLLQDRILLFQGLVKTSQS